MKMEYGKFMDFKKAKRQEIKSRSTVMKTKYLIAIITLLFLTSGCYGSIIGTVVDAETSKPIEGAVVLGEWTKRHGIGDYHTESVKVVEVVTDKEGKFKISGILDPFVDPPDVTVYKKGYICWSSRIIFPDYRNRTDFRWDKTYTFRLEHFKPEYSYDEHYYFITSAARPENATEKKSLFLKAYDEWEKEKAIRERNTKQKPGYRK